MILTYRYRLYPKPREVAEMERWCIELKHLWNHALEQRKSAWEMKHRQVSYLDQQKELTRWRALDVQWIGSLPYDPARGMLQRLDLAYRAFFRRCKDGYLRMKPGYPRFKSEVRSFDFHDPGTVVLGEKAIRFRGLGYIKYLRHRDPPKDGVLKFCIVSREGTAWYASIAYEIPDPPPPPSALPETTVGVDLGLKSLVALYDGSEGRTIPAPKLLVAATKKLRREQRRLSRRRRNSNRRARQRLKVAKCFERVRHQRSWFLHQVSHDLAEVSDLVVFEDLKIQNMLKNHNLARSISDAGWGMLRQMTKYKQALRSNRYLEVEARGTTQECSQCGRKADPPLTLKDRVFRCPCGYEADRDINSARIIHARGLEEVRRTAAEQTHGEREPTLRRAGRRAYQPRRAPSGNRESVPGTIVLSGFTGSKGPVRTAG